MNSMWGFGGVLFYYYNAGSDEWIPFQGCYFNGYASDNSIANGVITYVPVTVTKTNVENKIIRKFKGYRTEVNIDIINILAGDTLSLSNLFYRYQYYLDNDINIGIRVNCDSSATGVGGIMIEDVLLDSSISMKDIHKVEIGQRLSLKFIKEDLISTIPTTSRDRTDSQYNIVDENDDAILDESSNNIIIQMY